MTTPSNLPPGWADTTLGAICTKPQYGWTTKAKSGEGIRLLRTTDISSGTIDWSKVPICSEAPSPLEHYLLAENDIVISRAGSVGLSYLLKQVPLPSVFASYLIRFRPHSGISPRYVAFYLQSPAYWRKVQEASAGIALANVNASKLEAFAVPLAPLPEQRRIVAEIERQFSLLDAGVAGLKRVQANLKRYRASVLQAACEGRLVPTEAELARMEGRGYEPAAVLLSRILAERRTRWRTEQDAKKSSRAKPEVDHFFGKEVVNPQMAVLFEDAEADDSILNSDSSVDEVGISAALHLTFNEKVSAYAAGSDSVGSVVDPLFRHQPIRAEQKGPAHGFHYDQSSTVFKGYKEPAAPDTSTLPPLPEGWTWTSINSVLVLITSGSRGWAQYYSDEGVLFVRIGNLDRGTINIDVTDVQHVTQPESAEGARTRLIPGDILVSITANLGSVGLVPEGFEEAYINQHIALCRTVEAINRKFVAWYLVSESGQSRLNKLKRGATKVGLGLDDICVVALPLPPFAEQQRIVAEVERRLSVVDNLEQVVKANLKRADRLRQSILKDAFAGRLVPQDPADEPASALLERIKAEREAEARRAAGGSRKKAGAQKTSAAGLDLFALDGE